MQSGCSAVGRAAPSPLRDDAVIIFQRAGCTADPGHAAKAAGQVRSDSSPRKDPASRFPASDRRASRSLDNGDAFSLSGASNPLGFTHYCARSCKGCRVVKQKKPIFQPQLNSDGTDHYPLDRTDSRTHDGSFDHRRQKRGGSENESY